MTGTVLIAGRISRRRKRRRDTAAHHPTVLMKLPVKIVTRRASVITAATVSLFNELKDLYISEWYAKAVAWAYDTGVVTGDLTTKKFNPNADVTREQLALMMYRYAQYKGYDTDAGADFTGLKNVENISDWAADGINWAVGLGLISGIESAGVKDLAPQGTASRAQMAAILQRFCENLVQ